MKRSAFILFIILVYVEFSYCQTWERTFSVVPGAEIEQLKESYDHGFLLGAGIAYADRYRIGWIIKTDINGNELWEKKLGNGLREWDLRGIDNTPDGGIIIVGFTDSLSTENMNPFIIKLDVCGNTEWCRLYCPGNEHFDYGIKILVMS